MPEQGLGQGGVHTSHWLVEHHQLRVSHQRASHLEELALAAGQRTSEVIFLSVQLEPSEDLVSLLGDLPFLLAPQRLNNAGQKCSPRWPVAPSRMFSMTVSLERALVSWKVRTIPMRATL